MSNAGWEPARPIKLLVTESPIGVAPAKLQKALALGSKHKSPGQDAAVALEVQHAQAYALSEMKSALAKQPGLLVLSPKHDELASIDAELRHGTKRGLTQEEADRIRGQTGADAILRFGITDYGLTPRSWRSGYITFEVASTLAIAGLIAYSGSTVAKTAAGAYLAQETVEETAEAYAGSWGLDVVARPVRLEAELVRLNPVATLWKTADTGLSKLRLSRLVRPVDVLERNGQLDQATQRAVTKVASSLSAALNRGSP